MRIFWDFLGFFGTFWDFFLKSVRDFFKVIYPSQFSPGACVKDANKYRHLHTSTPSLQSDSRLRGLAQRYADKLLGQMMVDIRAGRRPSLKHDPDNRKERTGENLYYANTYEQGGMEAFCKKADKSWCVSNNYLFIPPKDWELYEFVCLF